MYHTVYYHSCGYNRNDFSNDPNDVKQSSVRNWKTKYTLTIDRQTDRQTNKHTYIEMGRNRHADIYRYIQTDRETDRQAGRQI